MDARIISPFHFTFWMHFIQFLHIIHHFTALSAKTWQKYLGLFSKGNKMSKWEFVWKHAGRIIPKFWWSIFVALSVSWSTLYNFLFIICLSFSVQWSKCEMSRSTVYYSVNLLTCTLCTAGVNRTGLGPNGVVVWSWVYLLGGWNRVVGETMLGSEKKSFNYYKQGTFGTELIKWQQDLCSTTVETHHNWKQRC